MKTLKITIASLFVISVLASCQSEEIVPVSPERTFIQETPKADKFEEDERVDAEKQTPNKQTPTRNQNNSVEKTEKEVSENE